MGFAEVQHPKRAGLLLAQLLSWLCPMRLRQEVRAPLGSQSHSHSTLCAVTVVSRFHPRLLMLHVHVGAGG